MYPTDYNESKLKETTGSGLFSTMVYLSGGVQQFILSHLSHVAVDNAYAI